MSNSNLKVPLQDQGTEQGSSDWAKPGLLEESLGSFPSETKLSHVFTGTIIYSFFNWLFDYPLYAITIWKLGMLEGGLLMAALSIPVDLITFKFYDWSKVDWFAIEYIKSMKNYQGRNIFKKVVSYIFNYTPIPIQLITLSIQFNSFIVTALLRKGEYTFHGLTKRDWKIFWSSYLVGQIYWIFVISGGLKLGSIIISFWGK